LIGGFLEGKARFEGAVLRFTGLHLRALPGGAA
jgi:hypothetical protein